MNLDSPDQATRDDIGQLLDLLKIMYDYVVVDTSGVFDDHALLALDRTDTIILVGTLDIPALKGLKLATRHWTCSTSPATPGSSSSTGPTPRSVSPSTSSSRPSASRPTSRWSPAARC